MFGIRHSATTDVGLQRDNNEDAFFASAKKGLWVVADGMGGHAAGEVASAIVIKTIEREVSAGRSLSEAIQKSHHDILNAANAGIGGRGMGSTVVAMKSSGDSYEVCWVGDSRAYLFCPSLEAETDYELRQLTTDHSYVQMLYQSGAISKDELSTHPEKNIITQCLGSIELSEVNVDRMSGDWVAGSQMLLCSDGLSDVVNENVIHRILSLKCSPEQKTRYLIKAALENGGKDNITVALVEAPNSAPSWVSQIRRGFGWPS